MRNREEEGTRLLNIERNPLILLLSGLLTAGVAWYNFQLFKDTNPLGFIMIIPTMLLLVQTLWLLLTPFAIFYENKVEIKQSFFHQKTLYFVDIKQISENKKGKVFIIYNDNEVKFVNLLGIKQAHIALLINEAQKFVSVSIKNRL